MQKVDFKINKQALLNNFSNMSKQLSKMNDFSPAGPPLSGRKLQIALFQRQDKVHNLTAPHAQGVQFINVHVKEKELFTCQMDMWNTSMKLLIKKCSNFCSAKSRETALVEAVFCCGNFMTN